MQVDKEKVKALQGIFSTNQDFTVSFIHNVLAENGNKLDDAVDALLCMSDSKEVDKVKEEEEEEVNENAPLDGKEAEKIQTLESMFGGDLTKSVICTVFHSNKGELEDTVDTLLNMTSTDLNPVPEKRPNDNERKAQEQEIQKYEEWKRLQQVIQESERKAIQENQRMIEIEKERIRKQQEDHQKVLQQQELLLKKAAEEQKKFQEERKKEELRKALEEQRIQEEKKKLADEKRKLEEERKRALEAAEAITRKKAEEEQKRKAEEARMRQIEEAKQKALLEQARARAEQKMLEAQLQKEAEENQRLLNEVRKRVEEVREEEKRKAEEQRRLREEKEALEAREREQLKKEAEEKEKERLKQEAENKRIESLLLRVEEEKKIMEEQRQREREERALTEQRMKAEQDLMKKNWEEQLRVLREKEEAMKNKLERERKAAERVKEEKRMLEERRKEEERLKEEQRRKEERLRLEQKIKEEREQEEQRIREELRLKEEQRLREEEERRRKQEEEENERRKKEEEEEQRKKAEEEETRKKAEEEERKKQEEEERKKQEETAVIEDENGLPLDTSAVFIASALNDPSSSQNKNNPLTVEVVEDKVTCSWDLEEGFNPSNWVGLYVVDQDDSYVKALYTKGEQAGQQVFKKVAPGHYEIRFFTDRSSLKPLARSDVFVVGPMATISAQLQAEHLLVHYAFDPLSNTPTTDWLGIYEKKEKKNKNYLTTGYGNREGRVLLKAPRKPGVYEVRLFVNGGYNDQARAEFTVEDHDCVNVEPNTVLSGDNAHVTWILRTVEPANGDWIGLYRAGEANNKNYLQCLYTNGTSVGSLSMQAPKEAGNYELRLFARNVGKYVAFRTSPSFSVM